MTITTICAIISLCANCVTIGCLWYVNKALKRSVEYSNESANIANQAVDRARFFSMVSDDKAEGYRGLVDGLQVDLENARKQIRTLKEKE